MMRAFVCRMPKGFHGERQCQPFQLWTYRGALASAARWDDYGLEDIGTTLPPVIAVGLTTKELSGAQAASLLCVPDRAQPTVLRSIVAQAAQDADPVTKRLAEDLAQDCLVGRVAWYDELAAVIAEHGGGEWTNRLVSQTEFRKTLKDERKKNGDTAKDQLRSSEILNGHAWQEGTLTDPSKFLEGSQECASSFQERWRIHVSSGSAHLCDKGGANQPPIGPSRRPCRDFWRRTRRTSTGCNNKYRTRMERPVVGTKVVPK